MTASRGPREASGFVLANPRASSGSVDHQSRRIRVLAAAALSSASVYPSSINPALDRTCSPRRRLPRARRASPPLCRASRAPPTPATRTSSRRPRRPRSVPLRAAGAAGMLRVTNSSNRAASRFAGTGRTPWWTRSPCGGSLLARTPRRCGGTPVIEAGLAIADGADLVIGHPFARPTAGFETPVSTDPWLRRLYHLSDRSEGPASRRLAHQGLAPGLGRCRERVVRSPLFPPPGRRHRSENMSLALRLVPPRPGSPGWAQRIRAVAARTVHPAGFWFSQDRPAHTCEFVALCIAPT